MNQQQNRSDSIYALDLAYHHDQWHYHTVYQAAKLLLVHELFLGESSQMHGILARDILPTQNIVVVQDFVLRNIAFLSRSIMEDAGHLESSRKREPLVQYDLLSLLLRIQGRWKKKRGWSRDEQE